MNQLLKKMQEDLKTSGVPSIRAYYRHPKRQALEIPFINASIYEKNGTLYLFKGNKEIKGESEILKALAG